MSEDNQRLESFRPLITRLRTDVCWIVKPGQPPSRINSPLTKARVLKHLSGGARVGACPIKAGEDTVRVAVLDFDSHKGATPWQDMQKVIRRVAAYAVVEGLTPVIFRSSGGAGAHAYFLWDEPQDAFSVRQLLSNILKSCGLENGTEGVAKSQVEIFPKQNSVGKDRFGNMFVLPMAGKSCLLDSVTLADLPGESFTPDIWEISEPVTTLEKPVFQGKESEASSKDVENLKLALKAIPIEEHDDYDSWFNILCGIHAATEGSDEGLGIAHEFSARSEKYDPVLLEEIKWPSIKPKHDSDRGAITEKSIYFLARQHGWVEDISDQFEIIKPQEPKRAKPLSVTAIKEIAPAKILSMPRIGKDQKIDANLLSVTAALQCSSFCGASIKFDIFKDIIVIAESGSGTWRSFSDVDYIKLRIRLQQGGFAPIGRDLIKDAVAEVKSLNSFDSAIQWAESLRWDGVKRIENFIHKYLGAEDSTYVKAVSRYMWTALAGRALVPGVQADMVPIFISPQGTRKTSLIASIAPTWDQFAEIDLRADEDKQARKMRGKLVGEIAELKGLASRADEEIRAFITRRKEEFRPLYSEYTTTYLRRILLIGTANKKGVLVDDTGNRRWLPVDITKCEPDEVAKDRDQLWAEAVHIFKKSGIDFKQAEYLAEDVHADHMAAGDDPWLEIVTKWLITEDDFTNKIPGEADYLQVSEVAAKALSIPYNNFKVSDSHRIGAVLKLLGYDKGQKRVDGRPAKVWVKNDVKN